MYRLARSQWNSIYDILIQECNARPTDEARARFLKTMFQKELMEHRFGGDLNPGGKLWNYQGRLYVNCFHKDRTPQRELIIERTNVRLLEVLGEQPETISGLGY